MPQSQILSQLQDAFAPFIKTPDELCDIRTQIAKYIESLQPQELTGASNVEQRPIPPHVTGVRRRYLTALYANIEANREYAGLRKEILPTPDLANDVESPAATVRAHVNLLHLRRRYRKCQVLSRYLAEAEKLAEENHLYEVLNPVDASGLNSMSAHMSATDDPAATSHAQQLVRDLQLAVVQATYDLQRERQLLENVKSEGPLPDESNPEAKLHALIATNAELTKWIEESLAKCDSINGLDEAPGHKQPAHDTQAEPIDHERAIRDHYEKYLEARTELLDATSQLALPLPAIEPLSDTPNPSQINADTNAKSTPLPIIPYVDSHILPLLKHQQTLSQSQTHLKSIMTSHARDLTEQLQRLNDESHLLPAYPILARPQQGEHAESDEKTRLLHAWEFAVDAAGTATEAAMEKQIAVGHQAVREVTDVLDALDEQQDMWGRLQ